MRRSLAFWAAFAASLTLAACGGRPNRDKKDKKDKPPKTTEPVTQVATKPAPSDNKKEIVVHLESEASHFNYLLKQEAVISRISIPNVVETLIREAPLTYEVQPLLAEKFEMSPDGMTLTFTLRDGVKWHDGEPFSSADVKFTFDKIFDEKANTANIRGGFEQFLDDKNRYEAPDPKTFILHFKKRSPFILASLCVLPIMPKHIFETGDFNEHPANRAPVGTGPYIFKEWKQGERVVIERNPNYWGEPPKIDKIIYRKITEPAQAFSAFKNSEVDLLPRLRPAQVEQLNDPVILENGNASNYFPAQYGFSLFNMERPIFKDKSVRKAISMLIDRETIKKDFEKNRVRLIESPFLYGSKHYNSNLAPIKYDPEAAKALLDSAGWKDADGDGVREKGDLKLSFTFILSAGSTTLEQYMTFVQEDLKKAGIQININKQETNVFFDNIEKHNFDMVSFLLLQTSPLQDMFESFHSTQSAIGGGNRGSYSNPEVDKLLEQIREEMDEAKRIEMEMKLQEILHEDLPMVFMFGAQVDYVARKKFSNTTPDPIQWFPIKDFVVAGSGAAPAP